MNNGTNTPSETVAGIAANIAACHELFSGAKVLLLAVFPSASSPEAPRRQRTRELNQLAAQLADGEHVVFLDLSATFVDATGHLRPELYREDSLHLTEQGYEAWAAAMAGELERMWAGSDA